VRLQARKREPFDWPEMLVNDAGWLQQARQSTQMELLEAMATSGGVVGDIDDTNEAVAEMHVATAAVYEARFTNGTLRRAAGKACSWEHPVKKKVIFPSFLSYLLK